MTIKLSLLSLFILFLFNFKAIADFSSAMSTLKKIKKSDQKIIDKARDCLPTEKNNIYDFCTGAQIENVQSFTSMSLQECIGTIGNRNYKTIYTNKNLDISAQEFDSFINSKKRAETFHDVKVVVFREGVSNRIDCLHELIHVYQWTSESKNVLSPPLRLKHLEKIEIALNLAVAEVEKSEKAKKIQEAQKYSIQISPYIDFLRQWSDMTDWLDEKDAHFFIFSHCAQLQCSLTDLDVATANLVKRKSYLPKSFYPELDRVGIEVLTKLKHHSVNEK